MTPLDKFDKAILNILQTNNRTTSDVISEQIGLSPAAVQRRIKKLRQDHIIQADVSIIDRQAIGRAMTFIVQVTMERERSDLLNAFKKRMKQNPQVQQCYYVTGSADFIVILTAADMAAYEQFTKQYFFDNSNIKSFQTNVAMDVVKAGLFVPVDDD